MMKKISKRVLVLFACCSSVYGLTSAKNKDVEEDTQDVLSNEENVKKSNGSFKYKNTSFDSVAPSIRGPRKVDFGSIKRDRGSDSRIEKIEKVNPIPTGMVKIKGGVFTIGRACKDIFHNPVPYRKVTISDFYMDKTEVTNADYRKYITILKDKLLELKNMNLKEMPKIKINNNTINYYKLKIALEKNLTEEFINDSIPNMALFKRDFDNSMADTYVENYYNSNDYDNYPVVCVTYENAVNFAKWRSLYLNEFCVDNDKDTYPNFCLPSYTQWMYASNGGIEWCNVYSWGGMYVRDENGNLKQNFKTANGDYSDNGKGIAFVSPVDAYEPNNFGLYDMGGNVKEWVNDAYSLSYFSNCVPFDPVCIDENNPIKIVVGGSFHSPARELQIGNIDTEHKDNARGDLGFRCVMSCPESKNPRTCNNASKRK